MHADPHAGNLLRVAPETHSTVTGPRRLLSLLSPRRWLRARRRAPRLAYLDFGLVSQVPLQVREALVCAVAQLIFGRDVRAVAALFGELMLLPDDALATPQQREALATALEAAASRLLDFDDDDDDDEEEETTRPPPGRVESSRVESSRVKSSQVQAGAQGRAAALSPLERPLPKLRFDALLGELAALAPAFAFELPPYFLNNARAIATLEGMAKSADPSFDVLQVVYPFALRRLLSADPKRSPLLHSTLRSLTTDEDGVADPAKLRALLVDSARLSGRRPLTVLLDAARTRGGRAFALDLAAASARSLWRRQRRMKVV